jgi:glycosyltransferase involved in cell wall biosynthesis
MPFALMWANENWTRTWDGAASEVLIAQDYRPGDDETMLEDFQRHFRDPRYIRLEGRPLFMLYRPGIVPQARDAIARWREIWRSNWREDPIIVMAQAFGDNDPRAFGLDGAVEFPPHKLTQHMPPINNSLQMLDPEFTGRVYDYDIVVRQSLDEEEPKFPLIKTAVPSWDNDARRQGAGLSIARSTPAKYEAWLGKLVERAERKLFFGEPIVCINAWNEWCEGTYLEPDVHFGAAYLNATGRAVARIGARVDGAPGQMLLVGHDAFPGGAQHLLLKIGQSLRTRHGVRLEFLLLDGGKLESEYKATAPTTVLNTGAGLEVAVANFVERGFVHALVNTAASGVAATTLAAAGVQPVLLIHELPRLLREKRLLNAAAQALQSARVAIFPAKFVRDAVLAELGLKPTDVAETVIMPQGSYKSVERSEEQAAAFRRSIEANDHESIVMGAGYADLRKGFDIFLQLWRLLNRDSRVHFCWLGGIDPDLQRWLGQEITVAEQTGTFHMMGLVSDVVPAYSAARAFALTSREDPFPTVALEALEAGVPVVAFAGTGGIPELLTEERVGQSVAYGDITEMAKALRRALAKDPGDAPARRKALIRDRFLFSDYVSRLMAVTLPTLPRVSVCVPNYNYARYMPERLGSIFGQSHPVHEIVVLDDCSADDSLTAIPAIAKDWNREIRLIPNLRPSGSVFAQWRKAAEQATGDWLWIAEADDSSNPDFLTRLLAVVNNDPRVVLAFSDSRTIHADGTPQWDNYKGYYASVEPGALTQSQVFDGNEFVERFLSVKNLILNVSAVLWRREALLAVLDSVGEELYSYKVAGDWRLYLQALAAPGARIAYESDSLNVHRRHAESVTHKLNIDKHLNEIRRCHDRARQIVPGGDTVLDALQARYLRETSDYLSGPAGHSTTKTIEQSADPVPP